MGTKSGCPYVDGACREHALCKKYMERSCLHCSNEVDYKECMKMDELTDDEYDELCTTGLVCNCSRFVPKW